MLMLTKEFLILIDLVVIFDTNLLKILNDIVYSTFLGITRVYCSCSFILFLINVYRFVTGVYLQFNEE